MRGNVGPRYYGHKKVIDKRTFKIVRMQAGFTQETLAEKARVGLKVVQRAEQGLPITKENAAAIAAALKVSLNELFIDAVSTESQPTELITQDAKPRTRLARSTVVTDSQTSDHHADAQHVYCADLTQLIAADAHIAKLTTGRTEPLAASAFEYLTTILCNDTLIYFETPKVLTLRTPVIRAWQKAALLSQPKDIPKLPVPVAERSDKHEVISKAFSELVRGQRYLVTSGLTNAQLLSGWTQYQLDDEDLQQQYWSVNKVDEMLGALDAFWNTKGLPTGTQEEIKRTLSTAPVMLSDIAVRTGGNARPSISRWRGDIGIS